jgi:hypothetical protein
MIRPLVALKMIMTYLRGEDGEKPEGWIWSATFRYMKNISVSIKQIHHTINEMNNQPIGFNSSPTAHPSINAASKNSADAGEKTRL